MVNYKLINKSLTLLKEKLKVETIKYIVHSDEWNYFFEELKLFSTICVILEQK